VFSAISSSPGHDFPLFESRASYGDQVCGRASPKMHLRISSEISSAILAAIKCCPASGKTGSKKRGSFGALVTEIQDFGIDLVTYMARCYRIHHRSGVFEGTTSNLQFFQDLPTLHFPWHFRIDDLYDFRFLTLFPVLSSVTSCVIV